MIKVNLMKGHNAFSKAKKLFIVFYIKNDTYYFVVYILIFIQLWISYLWQMN